MTMRISYPDVKSFQSILEALSKLIDEVALVVSPEGVRAKALDAAQVALIDINFPPEAFLEFDVEEEVRIGFNVSTLLKLLKRGKKGDRLEITVEGDKVVYTVAGVAVRRYKLLNLDVAVPEIPEARLDFNVVASLIVDPLKNAIRDAETVGDTIEFEASSDEALVIRGKGVALTETKISRESGALTELIVKEPSKSAYSIDYLKHVIALTRVADVVKLEFSSQMPLKLEFRLPGEARVAYLLAPKME